MTELLSIEPRRAKFIEQANAILERIPEASAEVSTFIATFRPILFPTSELYQSWNVHNVRQLTLTRLFTDTQVSHVLVNCTGVRYCYY